MPTTFVREDAEAEGGDEGDEEMLLTGLEREEERLRLGGILEKALKS